MRLSEWSTVQAEVREFYWGLTVVADAVSAVGALAALVEVGTGPLGLLAVTLYVAFWEVVAKLFRNAERWIPRPLRLPWRIFQQFVGIFLG